MEECLHHYHYTRQWSLHVLLNKHQKKNPQKTSAESRIVFDCFKLYWRHLTNKKTASIVVRGHMAQPRGSIRCWHTCPSHMPLQYNLRQRDIHQRLFIPFSRKYSVQRNRLTNWCVCIIYSDVLNSHYIGPQIITHTEITNSHPDFSGMVFSLKM